MIVDAPAMGHGMSLFAVPASASALGLGGLMAGECASVSALLADPARTAALVVTTAEELAIDETLELWPRIERELGRSPIAAVLNRTVAGTFGELPERPDPWCTRVEGSLRSDEARAGWRSVYASVARRIGREHAFAARVRPTPLGLCFVEDGLVAGGLSPRALLDTAAAALDPLFAAEEVRACRA